MLDILKALLNAEYVHNLSPFAIKFGSDFGIRWYGLSYLCGFVCAYYLMLYFSRIGKSPLTKAQIGDFVFAAAVGTLAGGRLGYCLFYNPSLFANFSPSFPFWGVLEVNKGGMASHGGIIGITVACYWFAWKHKLNAIHLLDLVTVTGPLGVFFGRIANFINGELFGRATSVSWAVKFPREILDWTPEKLISLTPVVEKLGVTSDLWLSYLQTGSGQIYGVLERILSALAANDSLVKVVITPLLTPRHPSQLYEAFAEGLCLFIFTVFAFLKSKRPGLAVSSFLLLYPVARIVCEECRLPDIGIGFQLWGLTRGQWLSVAMIILGALGIFFAQKKAKASAP